MKFDIHFPKMYVNVNEKKCVSTNWFKRVGETRHIRCLQLIIEWYVKMIAKRRQKFFFEDQWKKWNKKRNYLMHKNVSSHEVFEN